MRVLHISNDYYNSEIYRKLHHYLLAEGVDSVMFVPSDNRVEDRKDEPHVVLAKCYNRWDRYLYSIKQGKILKVLKQQVQKVEPDIVHGHFVFSSGYLCMRLKQEYGIPYVVAVRNTDVNVFFKLLIHLRKVGVQVMQNAEKIVFLSPVYRERVIDDYIPARLREGIREKSVVIPNGIDKFWISNPASKSRSEDIPLHLITAGAINSNKNQLAVAKAASILINQGFKVKYTVVGKVEDSKLFKELEKYNYVNYIEKCPKEELIKYYRRADVFVLPSITESFGLVYAEAISQGLPVVYSKGQGFDGQFAEGEVGYHADCNSPSDIANCILRCLVNYNEMSQCCTTRAKRFDWEQIVKKYIQIYSEIKY